MCCKFVNFLVNLEILRPNCQKHGEGLFAIFFRRHNLKSTSSQFKKEAYIKSNIRSKRKRKTEEETEGGKMEYRDSRYA